MDKALELDYGQQVAKTEYKRVLAVCLFLGIGFIIQSLNILLNKNYPDYIQHDLIPRTIVGIIGILIFELIMLFYIKSFVKQGKVLSKRFIWGYTYFESLFPSLLIYSTCVWSSSATSLDSPIFLFYVIFIILSTLHLERSYSILTGIVAGIGYISVVYSVLHDSSIHFDRNEISYHYYYIRGVGLIACGILAGVVTAVIKSQFQQT